MHYAVICRRTNYGSTKSGKGEGRLQNEFPPSQDPKFTFRPFSSAGWFQMDWNNAVWAGRSIATLWTPHMPIFGPK